MYGDSGTGKTIFGAGFPKPLLLIDTDKGILSVRTTDVISDEDKVGIHPVEVTDFSPDQPTTNPKGFDVVKGILEAVVRTGEYQGVRPKTVVVDSFTTTSQMGLNKALFLNGHLGQQPSLPDYGGQRRHLEAIIKLGIGLPCHFLAICHEQFLKDEYTGRVWLVPMIVGKLAKEIPLYFDEVYHSRTGLGKDGRPRYEMDCSASGLVSAKSRLGLAGVQELKWEVVERVLARLQGMDSEKKAEPSVSENAEKKEVGGQSGKGKGEVEGLLRD